MLCCVCMNNEGDGWEFLFFHFIFSKMVINSTYQYLWSLALINFYIRTENPILRIHRSFTLFFIKLIFGWYGTQQQVFCAGKQNSNFNRNCKSEKMFFFVSQKKPNSIQISLFVCVFIYTTQYRGKPNEYIYFAYVECQNVFKTQFYVLKERIQLVMASLIWFNIKFICYTLQNIPLPHLW